MKASKLKYVALSVVMVLTAVGLGGYFFFKSLLPDGEAYTPPPGKAPTVLDVVDKIITGNNISSKNPGNHLNVEASASFTLDGDDFDFDIKIDIDNSRSDYAKNFFIAELKKNRGAQPVVGIYYEDYIAGEPYLYIDVEGQKHAIKFASMRKLAANGVPGLFDGGLTTVDSVFAALPLGNYGPLVRSVVDALSYYGPTAFFRDAYISNDGKTAGFEADTALIKRLLNVAADAVSGIAGVNEVITGVSEILGGGNGYEDIKNAIKNIPDFKISVKAEFAGNGGLDALSVTAKTGERQVGGVTMTLGAPLMTAFPGNVDILEYSRHNLINFEVEGLVRLEAPRVIDDNGDVSYWSTSKSRPQYVYTIQADLDPFALLNGVDGSNIAASIMAMGKFRLYVRSDTPASSSYARRLELVFDPRESGMPNMYGAFTLLGQGALPSDQYLNFMLPDLIEYIAGQNLFENSVSSVAAAAAGSALSDKNIIDIGKIGILSGLTNIVDLLGLKVYEKDANSPFGLTFTLRNIDGIESFVDFLMFDDGQRIAVTVDKLSYGSMQPETDIYNSVRGSFMVAHDIAPSSSYGILTEYDYAQRFQDGYDTVDMNVSYMSSGTVGAPERKSLKVIKMLGFDSLKPGEQTVSLFLAIPPVGARITAIFDAFTDAMLPYSLIKYTYNITVRPPESATPVYTLSKSDIMSGENLYNIGVLVNGKALNAPPKILAFNLYDAPGGTLKNDAVDSGGKALTAGKYWIRAELSNGEFAEQSFYISELFIPDLSKTLIDGNPVTSIYGFSRYYSEALGHVVVEDIVPTLTNRSGASPAVSTNVYLRFESGIIKGNGFVNWDVMDMGLVVGVRYTFNTAKNGQVSSESRWYNHLPVIINTPNYLAVQSQSLPQTSLSSGQYLSGLPFIYRISNAGNIYKIDQITGNTDLVFVGNHYEIWDKNGNVIANKITVKIADDSPGNTVTTSRYYDEATGTIKNLADIQDLYLQVGSAITKYLFLTISYDGPDGATNSVTVSGSFTINPAYGRISKSSSPGTHYMYSMINSMVFSYYAVTSDNWVNTSSIYMRFDYKSGRYYLPTGASAKRYYAVNVDMIYSGSVVSGAIDGRGRLVAETLNGQPGGPNTGSVLLRFTFDFDGHTEVIDTNSFTYNGKERSRTNVSSTVTALPTLGVGNNYDLGTFGFGVTMAIKGDGASGRVYISSVYTGARSYYGSFKVYDLQGSEITDFYINESGQFSFLNGRPGLCYVIFESEELNKQIGFDWRWEAYLNFN